MRKLINKIRSRGISLPEALVMVIIVGYALVPIIGTFNNTTHRATKFEHTEKLRILARSRMNKEIAASGYDQSAVDLTTMYHYEYYDDQTPPNKLYMATTTLPVDFEAIATVSSILYAYKLSVELKEQLQLATYTSPITDSNSEYLRNITGLKAIVVTAEIDPDYVVATQSVSYFTLISSPKHQGNFMYVCDSNDLAIKVIDPVSKSVAETFQIPKADPSKDYDDDHQDPVRPWNIAVHPNGRVLVYQSKQKVFAINIDHASDHYGESVCVYDFGHDIADVKKDDATHAQEDRGIAFRPDGRYLYVTDRNDKNLHVLEPHGFETKPITWPPASCTSVYTSGSASGDKYTAFHAGTDGWLYIPDRDNHIIYRYSMFPTSIGSPRIQNYNNLGNNFHCVGIKTSPDGKYVYAADDKHDPETVIKFRSKDFALVGKGNFALGGGGHDNQSLELSADGKYLFLTDHKNAPGQSSADLFDISNLDWSNPPDPVARHSIYQAEREANYLCLSPDNNEIAWISEPSECHFANIASAANDDFTSSLPAQNTVVVTSTDNALSDIVKRNIQYCLVGCSDATIKYLDIYGGFIDENLEKTGLPHNPYALALNQHGDKFLCSYGCNDGGNHSHSPVSNRANVTIDLFDTYKSTPRLDQGGYSSKGVGLIATDTYTTSALFINGERNSTSSSSNGYYSPHTPIPTGLVGRKCRDVDVSTDWVVKQVVSLNKGGFLILFSNDGSKGTPAGTTMLDWIGEHKWNSDPRKAGDGSQTWPQYKGTYERFARWYSSADHNFPPKYATKMAISFDDSLLAFSTKKPSDCRIYIYDFNAQNFGALTQMEGLIIDEHASAGDFDTPVYAGDSSHHPGARFHGTYKTSMNSAFTANHTLGNMQNEPFNFYDNFASIFPASMGIRIFGYFRPIDDVYEFDSTNEGCTRACIGDTTSLDYCEFGSWPTDAANDTPTVMDRFVSSYTSAIMQVEFKDDNIGHAGQCFVYSTTSGQTYSTKTNVSSNKYGAPPSGWQHVSAAETMPFLFRPQCLFNEQFSNTGSLDAAMVFSRDAADPILYTLDDNYDGLFTVRLGYGMHKIKLPNADYLNTDLAISPDGQTLIAGKEDSSYRVYTINISSPYTKPNGASYDFGSNINPTVAGTLATATGYVTASITLPVSPTCLATLPYRHYYSKRDVYEPLSVTLPSNLANPNGAAIASGGIYFLGGGTTLGSVSPRNLIWRFNPIDNSISSLSVALNKAVKKNSVVSYNDEIYSFGGDTTSSYSPCDWVQRYCIASNSVESSFDTAGNDEFRVSRKYSSDPGGTIATDTDHTTGQKAWHAFDNSTTGHWGTTNNSPPDLVGYNFQTPVRFNQIRLRDTDTSSGQAPKNCEIWTDSDLTLSGANLHYTFVALNTSDAWQRVDFPLTPISVCTLFNMTSIYGSTDNIGELEYWLTGLRKVSPIMTGPTSGTGPNPPYAVTSDVSDHPSYLAFDGSVGSSHYWCSNDKGTVVLELGKPDIVNIIRMKSEQLINFTFSGSNSTNTGPWTPLLTVDEPDNDETTFETFAVSNTTAYKYYALKVNTSGHNHIHELEYYSTTPKQNILTKTIGDDLQNFKMALGAACTTPYGIFYAGGRDDTGTTTDTALLYWPQAIATTTAFGSNYSQFGISRELPSLPHPAKGHCLVWHKGKVYRIGGSDNAGASGVLANIYVYAPATNAWTTIDSTSTPPFPAHFERYVAAACSYGDEIYIFGGTDSSGNALTSAYAWNPETGTERRLHDLPNNNTVGMTAVPCAGTIYLFGGASGLSSSGSNQIIKYTP